MPPLGYNDPVTLDGFFFLVTGAQFRGQFDFLSAAGPSEFVRYLPDLWGVLMSRGTAVMPVLGFVGLLVLVLRRPAFGLLCSAVLVTGLYLWANYLRLEHYLLVPWLLLAIGTAVVLEAVARVLDGAIEYVVGRAGGGLAAASRRQSQPSPWPSSLAC